MPGAARLTSRSPSTARMGSAELHYPLLLTGWLKCGNGEVPDHPAEIDVSVRPPNGDQGGLLIVQLAAPGAGTLAVADLDAIRHPHQGQQLQAVQLGGDLVQALAVAVVLLVAGFDAGSQLVALGSER